MPDRGADPIDCEPSPGVRASPLRISILAPELSGGGMTRAYWLAQVLRSAGHQARILGVREPEDELYPAPPAGVEVGMIPAGPFRSTARELIDRAAGDILYAIKPRRHSFGVALLARRATGQPVLLDIDDSEPGLWEGVDAPASRIPRRFLADPMGSVRALTRRIARAMETKRRLGGRRLARSIQDADAVTVNTRFLQSRYAGTYIPSGKDTSRFDPDRIDADASRAKLGLSPFRVLMFAGTPQPHKGLEDLLVAMETLRWPDLRLVIVGGRRTPYLEHLLLGWPRWIVRLPRFPLEEMPSVVAAAHAVVTPQRDTPTARAQFPMKLTDGMAMAKPILATRVGDIPEILGDAGYLAAPSNPAELAERLRALFADPGEAAARGRRARQRCVKHYSLAAVSRCLEPVLESWIRSEEAAERDGGTGRFRSVRRMLAARS